MFSAKKLLWYIFLFHSLKSNIKSNQRLVTTIALLAAVKYIYLAFFRNKAKLYFDKNLNNLKRLNKCPSIQAKEFNPAPLFPGCLMQTLAASVVVKRNNNISFSEEIIPDDNMEDTGLRLNWPKFKDMNINYIRDDVLILVIPGMTGTCDDVYVNKFVEYLTLVYEYRSVVFHYRMVGEDIPIKKNGQKTFCLTQDLEETLKYIKAKYPQFKYIYAIGHSYGANFLVNYLGKSGENSLINGAVSVANPYCLVTAFRLMKGKIYDMIIVFLFSSLLKKKRAQFNKVQQGLKIDLQESIDSQTTNQVISRFNKKLLGYKSVGEYQRKHSSVRMIHKVRVPLFGLSSEDDQISHKRGIPKEEFSLNPNCILMVTKSGGHVGYIESKNLLYYKFWYFQPCLEFLQAVIDEQVPEQKTELQEKIIKEKCEVESIQTQENSVEE